LFPFISQRVQYVDTIEQSGSKSNRKKKKKKKRHRLYNFSLLVGVEEVEKL